MPVNQDLLERIARATEGTRSGIGAVPTAPAAPESLVKRGAKLIGKGALAFAPVAGAVLSATDSQEKVSQVASNTGLDYNSFGGRISANAVNFLQDTGNAATFGAAGAIGRGIADVAGGGSFFKPYTPPGAVPVAAPAATAPIDAAPVTPAVPVVAPPAAFTSADIDGNRVPVSGTGAIRNNTTGEVTNIGTPRTFEPAAPTRYRPLNSAGGFALGALGLKQIVGDASAKAKAAEASLKLPAAQKDAITVALARQQLALDPNNLQAVSDILSGKSSGGQYSIPPTNEITRPGDPVTRLNRATGAVEKILPTPVSRGPALEENITASMQAKGLSREQAKQAYKAQGYDISKLK